MISEIFPGHPERLFEYGPETDIRDIYRAARAARRDFFCDKIFIYGFLYISTFCRNDCAFCQYRSSNKALPRFRKQLDEILPAAEALARDGVHLLDITMGEDSHFVDPANTERLAWIIEAVRRETGLPVMVSPGLVSGAQLAILHDAGADWYACYQETHSPELFQKLRIEQDFDLRSRARNSAAQTGMLVEDGILAGVGESPKDLADSLFAMRDETCSQVRAMAYVPHAAGLNASMPDRERRFDRECRLIAALRLLMPERLVPASLDVDGLPGLRKRLRAGANVVTSILPTGFSGVASNADSRPDPGRTVAAVQRVVEEEGLRLASQADYHAFMRKEKQSFKAGQPCA